MVVYADVLLIINLYINYFLVRGTFAVLRQKPKVVRILAASAAGAAGALIMLAPQLPIWAIAAVKIAVGTAVVFIAFGRQKRVDFIISLLCFLIIGCIFAGAMSALWWFAAPFDMIIKNGSAYFNIPIIWLVVLTMAAYGITLLIKRIASRGGKKRGVFTVSIRMGDKTCRVEGLADTGCKLCDAFSGTPIVICAQRAVREIIPQNVSDYLSGRDTDSIRLAPCSTVCAQGVIPLFKADEIIIGEKKADALIGVSVGDLGEYDCVFSPDLI